MHAAIQKLSTLLKAKSYKLKVDEGFTLIELLVSIGVIAVVSSVIFANVGTRQSALTRSAQKVALAIREAQNLSLAPSDEPICVYGVRFVAAVPANTYFIYRRPACPDPRTNPANNMYDGSPSNVVETVTLESGVTFAGPLPQDVSFEAPEPITWVNGVANSSLSITLTSSTGSRTISVSRFGRVEIQ